jgi:hypothetical protein
MSRTISLLLSKTDPASSGSVAYVNKIAASVLAQAGWSIRPFSPHPLPQAREPMIPLALASAHALESGAPPADFALHDDAGVLLRTPSRRWARRNLVLYHGLAYGAGAWMGNPDIDLHCANSPYLARVIRSMLAFPDWSARRCLDPRAFDAVTDVTLPLPCLLEDKQEQGSFAIGAELPAPVARLLDSGAVLGHAVQPRKQDLLATASILYWLNQAARERGADPIKLMISSSSLEGIQRQQLDATLAPAGYRCDDLFVPVPPLRQEALFRLMRGSRFCLAYNRFPEPFGFYVLESVFHGCPVYTNGIGNNRFLLPPGHGIVVDETLAMNGATVDARAYRHVAARIYEDLASPARTSQECARGTAFMRSRWSRAAFGRSLEAALTLADSCSPGMRPFEELVVSLGPLVRHFDPSSGRCLNDYADTVLDAEERTAVAHTLGRRCADLDAEEMHSLEKRSGLFRRGLLTLVPPDQAPSTPT